MHPLLSNMPPLAAAATECRLVAMDAAVRQEPKDPVTDGHPCSVRVHGDLVGTYMLRAVGGPSKVLVREDPPRRFDKVFYVDDSDAFFRSYLTCADVLQQMLARTPVLGEFDLAADNWDQCFPPHDLAAIIVSEFRCATEQNMGVAPPCNLDVLLDVRVRAVYSEPRALLIACKEATATLPAAGSSATECCVCMEHLAAPKAGSSDTVMLPCSHVFLSSCLLPWFHRVSTCPMCRRDMATHLVAITGRPQGTFPDRET